MRTTTSRRLATVGILALPVALLATPVASASTLPAATDLAFTGAAQTYVVPAHVCGVTASLAGGQGGEDYWHRAGGNGGSGVAVLAVQPGQVLGVAVGGQGAFGYLPVSGGQIGNTPGPTFGGGGSAGPSAGAGGGATSVSTAGKTLVVVGGGGGSGADGSGGSSAGEGGGPGLPGTSGSNVSVHIGIALLGGLGGTPAWPGSGGSLSSTLLPGFESFMAGVSGRATLGGAGGAGQQFGGGGGGGGYFGGGGGAALNAMDNSTGAPGGGGGGYIDPSVVTASSYWPDHDGSGNGAANLAPSSACLLPVAPNVTAKASGSKVVLSVDPSQPTFTSATTGYLVTCPGKKAVRLKATATKATCSGLKATKTYTFKVAVLSAEGTSPVTSLSAKG